MYCTKHKTCSFTSTNEYCYRSHGAILSAAGKGGHILNQHHDLLNNDLTDLSFALEKSNNYSQYTNLADFNC